MKGSSMNTHMGKIVVHNEVIAQYAGGVAVECFGIVGMAGVSVKDGLVKLLKMDSITRGISVTLNKIGLADKFVDFVSPYHSAVCFGCAVATLAVHNIVVL